MEVIKGKVYRVVSEEKSNKLVNAINGHSDDTMRIEKAIKVLHDLQKYRRDQHVPAKYPMPHPKRIGEAIDCAIRNMRTCVNISRVVEAYEALKQD